LKAKAVVIAKGKFFRNVLQAQVTFLKNKEAVFKVTEDVEVSMESG